jgi:predicted nucleic acid-binding Zn ribbon protein
LGANAILWEARVVMKKCPFCAEDIQDEAIKCKHCGELLDASVYRRLTTNRTQWYFGVPFLVLAVFTVGPLALPLIWFRPRTSQAWKIGLTIAILVLTWLVYLATIYCLHYLKAYCQLIP